MFQTQRADSPTAIERFRSHDKIEINKTAVYGTYTSGVFNAFYATEADAVAHCQNPESGAEFNGQWFQDSYSTFEPGELFAVVDNESVYLINDRSRYIDAIGGRWQMPFVQWEEEAPKSA